MKKIFVCLMLLCSMSNHAFAQASPDPEKIFENQPNPYRRSFFFDLGKKERMQIELYELSDLPYLRNIDSIVNMFIQNLETVADSIPAAFYSRLIEYTIDGPNMKRLSMSKHGYEKTQFVFTDGETSLLKVEQDTIIIVGTIPGKFKHGILQRGFQSRHYRISLFLNDLDRLSLYRNRLNTRMQSIINSMNEKWMLGHDGYMHVKSNPNVSSLYKRGYTMGGNIVTVRPAIDIQNYKSWFVPSVTGGFVFSTNKNLVHREYYIGKESHFLFTKNAVGQSKTYINIFVTASYGQSNMNPYTKKAATLYPYISLGYLVKRKGEFYDKHTFKLAIGQFSLFANYTKIEPVMYFHDFFRAPTPSLRITQHF